MEKIFKPRPHNPQPLTGQPEDCHSSQRLEYYRNEFSKSQSPPNLFRRRTLYATERRITMFLEAIVKKSLALMTLLMAVTLAACNPSGDASPQPGPTLAPVPESSITDTFWVLDAYGPSDNPIRVVNVTDTIFKDARVTARFDSVTGQVSGSAGVNSYGGRYETDGDRLTVPGPIISTLMAGPEPLMDQEVAFLKLLQSAESYQITGSKLQVNCGDQVLLLTR